MPTPLPMRASDYDLIRRIARKLRRRLPPMVQVEDLINDGYFGLADAIRLFDPSRSECFERYAARRIRGAMLDGLRSRAWVPRLIKKPGEPSPGVELREVERPTAAESVCDSVDESDAMEWVRSLVTTLPRQARRVLHLYYYEEHEMKEVAMILGVSEARVSQVRSRAIDKLKKRAAA